jgi:serpin B
MLVTLGISTAASACAAPPSPEPLQPAALAINQLGLNLHRQLASSKPDSNLLLSPYSLQVALAMTYAGADGATRTEMARVLHFGGDETALHTAFQSLESSLREASKGASTFSFNVANRLFGNDGLVVEKPFRDTLARHYAAPLEIVKFSNPTAAARRINSWVAEQTHDRIQDLIAPSLLDADTRLVLVNALHLKAAWIRPFTQGLTKPRPFHLGNDLQVTVPTMHEVDSYGFRQFEGFRAIALPYRDVDLQFVLFVPNQTNGLAAAEARLTPEVLSACRALPFAELDLYLPRLKLTPPSAQLRHPLQALGLRTAFDVPPGSADFSRMTDPRRNALKVSEVVQKTFLQLDEKGTEAAAATAVLMAPSAAPLPPNQKPKPIVVRVDRPFAFAIQHRESGACLFLGRITDPR